MKVIISGALQGLGACLTKAFLNSDDTVYAIIMPGMGLGELQEIKDNPKLKIICADLEKKHDMILAYEQVLKFTDSVDVIINVAGILLNKNGLITQDSYECIEKTFKINTISAIYMNNLFLPILQKSNNPVIINICSEARTIDDAGDWFVAYCISKTALTQYCFGLRATLKKLKIKARVFAVHPGRMSTAMGGDNSEITPQASAEGIWQIAKGIKKVNEEEVYINYKGEPMLLNKRRKIYEL